MYQACTNYVGALLCVGKRGILPTPKLSFCHLATQDGVEGPGIWERPRDLQSQHTTVATDSGQTGCQVFPNCVYRLVMPGTQIQLYQLKSVSFQQALKIHVRILLLLLQSMRRHQFYYKRTINHIFPRRCWIMVQFCRLWMLWGFLQFITNIYFS